MTFGLIVGSGVLSWDLGWTATAERQTEYGPASAAPLETTIHGRQVLALPRHGDPHRIAPHAVNYRANLKLLESHGVRGVVALNTVGGISSEAATGSLLVPDQIIDYSWGRAQSFNADNDVRHIDFSEPYDGALRQALVRAGGDRGIETHDGGVMGVTQGPRLETAAEIQRMARDGCAVVGMTGMPEAALARELSLPFACLCLIVNRAAGLSSEVISLDDIQAVATAGMQRIVILLDRFFERLEGFD